MRALWAPQTGTRFSPASLRAMLGPCLGAYFPSVFHFPSIECGRPGSHNIPFSFPRCLWTLFLEFFVPIHAELLEWLPAHTMLFYTSEPMPVLFSLPRLPLQHSFLLKTFYLSPKTLPRILSPTLSLPSWQFVLQTSLKRYFVSVFIMRAWGMEAQGCQLGHLCCPDDWHRKHVQQMLV